MPLNEIIARFADQGLDALPVVDAGGAYRGTITAAELERSAQDNLLDSTAGQLARTTLTLAADQTLEDALGMLVSNDRSGLPVLSTDGRHVTGWITHRDVLRAYTERLHQSVATAETKTLPTGAPPTPDTPADPITPSSAHTDQRSLARLQGYRIIDLELNHDRPPVGQRVVDLNLPPSSLVLAVRRDGSSFTAEDDTVLRRGDRLSVVVPADHAYQLASLIEGLTAPSAPDRDMPT